MLLAIAVVALTTRMFSSFGPEGLVVALMISLGIGGLVLVATYDDRRTIIRTCVFAMLGLLVNGMLGPRTMSSGPNTIAGAAFPIVMTVLGVTLFGSLAYRKDASNAPVGEDSQPRE
jgi:hypothetical protein